MRIGSEISDASDFPSTTLEQVRILINGACTGLRCVSANFALIGGSFAICWGQSPRSELVSIFDEKQNLRWTRETRSAYRTRAGGFRAIHSQRRQWLQDQR